MNCIKGNIYNHKLGCFLKGAIYFDKIIQKIVPDNSVSETVYILPGLIDAHVHIESSMVSPLEYSRECVKHGVIGTIADPHEIANVCGLDGIRFMIDSANSTPMKIFFGAPSCVPATTMETSGAIINSLEIETLFKEGYCTHLAEMMNFPGVIFKDSLVLDKINIAKKYNKQIDGHAPGLSGKKLMQYIDTGITTDHECTTLSEALEKISCGMKIMLRESSGSKDFDNLDPLIELHPDEVMFCSDDCHPDDLKNEYIDSLFRRALRKGYKFQNVCLGSSINSIEHYDLPIGKLQQNDYADFIVVDNLIDLTILKTVIDGIEVFDGKNVNIPITTSSPINNFYINVVFENDLKVMAIPNKNLNIIKIIADSLVTKKITKLVGDVNDNIDSDIENDILKIVVVNRYTVAKPIIGFVNGFGLKRGAIGGSVAHDSHNIIVAGTNDQAILRAINIIQENKGGLVAVDENEELFLSLPIGGLMSVKSCDEVAIEYSKLNNAAFNLGTRLKAPFMTLSFMALLVIPELKIGDKGLFDANNFRLIDLQS